MDLTNSLVYRKHNLKRHRKNSLLERQDRMKNQIDTLPNVEYQHNDLNHEVLGLSNNSNFSSPVLVSTLSSDAGLFPSDDAPIQIRSLLIKSQFKPLTNKEVDRVRNYYYMDDLKSKNQAEKDNRFVLSEGYKLAKKAVGLNGKPLII